MKIKKKLRDLTRNDFDNFKKTHCISINRCEKCPFYVCECMQSSNFSWIDYKDLFSDKFLDQEIEIEVLDILTKEDKEYLETIIKPMGNQIKIMSIVKSDLKSNGYECFAIDININANGDMVRMVTCIEKNSILKNMRSEYPYTLEELGLSQEEKPKSEYKITLTDFWNSKEKLVIHCNTEEKADKLLKAFDKLGKKWASGNSYLKGTNYTWYKQETCYSNARGYDNCDNYKQMGYTIYEFEDVDLDN